MMFDRIAAALQGTGYPARDARRVLRAIREPSPEVLATGISAAQWRSAIDAMTVQADGADAIAADADMTTRRAEWTAMRSAFESLGCNVTGEGDSWAIEGPFVGLTIDLSNGEVIGMEGSFGNDVDRFNRAVDVCKDAIRWGSARRSDEERKRELRKTHRWDNARKGWAPLVGDGPIIRSVPKRPW